jgi:hypothetical protein
MKCWICGKEENNADIKINIGRLIGAVQEAFDNEQAYRLCFVAKKWYQMDEQEREHANWRERNEHGSNNEVSDLCEILGIDCSKLYAITRLVRKWEQKRSWERCFPAEENSQKILNYLSKDKNDPFAGPHINYVNWDINNKAEKAAKQKAA